MGYLYLDDISKHSRRSVPVSRWGKECIAPQEQQRLQIRSRSAEHQPLQRDAPDAVRSNWVWIEFHFYPFMCNRVPLHNFPGKTIEHAFTANVFDGTDTDSPTDDSLHRW